MVAKEVQKNEFYDKLEWCHDKLPEEIETTESDALLEHYHPKLPTMKRIWLFLYLLIIMF